MEPHMYSRGILQRKRKIKSNHKKKLLTITTSSMLEASFSTKYNTHLTLLANLLRQRFLVHPVEIARSHP